MCVAAQDLPVKSDLWSSDFCTLSARCVDMSPQLELPPQTEVLSSFWCFIPFACGFNCCRQQTVIPLKLPCVHVCVSLFFGGEGGGEARGGKCRTACLCVCMRDVQRNALWYRNAISSLSVYGCIGFIRIWKCWAAVPGVSGSLCPLPLLRSHSFTGLGGLPGWLMH